jgi:hypothetical protein
MKTNTKKVCMFNHVICDRGWPDNPYESTISLKLTVKTLHGKQWDALLRQHPAPYEYCSLNNSMIQQQYFSSLIVQL